MNRIRLKQLVAVGPRVPRVSVPFASGLSVIHGAANTGKSHVVALIDFALGSSSPPDPIPEQKGYEGVLLGVELSDGSQFTLCRSLSGGHVLLAQGIRDAWPHNESTQVLSTRHGDNQSLSKFLLGQMGTGGRLRINKAGKPRDLSFRDMARVAIVSEGKIQSPISPAESGQYVTRTAERSAFKFFLTGIDDRTIEEIQRQRPNPVRVEAQLEIIDRQIARLAQEVENYPSIVDLKDQLDRTIAAVEHNIAAAEDSLVHLKQITDSYGLLRSEHDANMDRFNEIGTLSPRFKQLDESYEADIQRLEAIVEAGMLIAGFQPGACPVCGADPTNHLPGKACEEAPEAIAEAAGAEISKIVSRKGDLGGSILALNEERAKLGEKLRTLKEELEAADRSIQDQSPEVERTRERLEATVEARSRAERQLSKLERLEELTRLKVEISPDEDGGGDSLTYAGLNPAQKEEFSLELANLLAHWGFPNAQRATFDESSYDVEIAGKSRRANGKGVRAILHAAFSIAFAKYCVSRGLPHIGFVVLDSPLVTYRDPLQDESELDHSQLKNRVFDYFSTWVPSVQIVLVENVDPPAWVDGLESTTVFTGNLNFGRQGFYGSSRV